MMISDTMAIRVVLLLLSAVVATEANYSFITLGDWGGAALEEPSKPYSKNVKEVAGELTRGQHELVVLRMGL